MVISLPIPDTYAQDKPIKQDSLVLEQYRLKQAILAASAVDAPISSWKKIKEKTIDLADSLEAQDNKLSSQLFYSSIIDPIDQMIKLNQMLSDCKLGYLSESLTKHLGKSFAEKFCSPSGAVSTITHDWQKVALAINQAEVYQPNRKQMKNFIKEIVNQTLQRSLIPYFAAFTTFKGNVDKDINKAIGVLADKVVEKKYPKSKMNYDMEFAKSKVKERLVKLVKNNRALMHQVQFVLDNQPKNLRERSFQKYRIFEASKQQMEEWQGLRDLARRQTSFRLHLLDQVDSLKDINNPRQRQRPRITISSNNNFFKLNQENPFFHAFSPKSTIDPTRKRTTNFNINLGLPKYDSFDSLKYLALYLAENKSKPTYPLPNWIREPLTHDFSILVGKEEAKKIAETFVRSLQKKIEENPHPITRDSVGKLTASTFENLSSKDTKPYLVSSKREKIKVMDIPKMDLAAARANKAAVEQDLQQNFLFWNYDIQKALLKDVSPEAISNRSFKKAVDDFLGSFEDLIIQLEQAYSSNEPQKHLEKAFRYNPAAVQMALNKYPEMAPYLCQLKQKLEKEKKSKEYWDDVWKKAGKVATVATATIGVLALVPTGGGSSLLILGATTTGMGALTHTTSAMRNYAWSHEYAKRTKVLDFYLKATGQGSPEQIDYHNSKAKEHLISSILDGSEAALTALVGTQYIKPLRGIKPSNLFITDRGFYPIDTRGFKGWRFFRKYSQEDLEKMPLFFRWMQKPSEVVTRRFNYFGKEGFHFTPYDSLDDLLLKSLKVSPDKELRFLPSMVTGTVYSVPQLLAFEATVLSPLRSRSLNKDKRKHMEFMLGESFSTKKAVKMFDEELSYLETTRQMLENASSPLQVEQVLKWQYDYITKNPDSHITRELAIFLGDRWKKSPKLLEALHLPKSTNKRLTTNQELQMLAINHRRTESKALLRDLLLDKPVEEIKKHPDFEQLFPKNSFRHALFTAYEEKILCKERLKTELFSDIDKQAFYGFIDSIGSEPGEVYRLKDGQRINIEYERQTNHRKLMEEYSSTGYICNN